MSTSIYQEKIVICEICGKQGKQLANHFKIHGLTLNQYKELYPNCPTISKDYSEKLSIKSTIINAPKKGKKRDQLISQKISKTKKERALPSPWLGKKHSEESKKKMSDVKKQKFKSGELVSPNLGKPMSAETKAKISKSLKGRPMSEEAKANLKIAMDKLRASEDFVPSMLGKTISEETRVKLKLRSQRQADKTKIKTTERISNHLNQFNIEVLDRTKKGYNLKCNNCGEHFHRVNSVLVPHKYDHYNGEYCPICFPSDSLSRHWNFSKFKLHPETKTIKGELYLLKMWNDNEEFLKVGITSVGIKNRYRKFDTYFYEVIKIIDLNMFDAYSLEQKILKDFRLFKYNPLIKFGGKSECIDINQLDNLLLVFPII
jgi:hypothetical protein